MVTLKTLAVDAGKNSSSALDSLKETPHFIAKLVEHLHVQVKGSKGLSWQDSKVGARMLITWRGKLRENSCLCPVQHAHFAHIGERSCDSNLIPICPLP